VLRAMFKGLDETLDGEWVPKKGKYCAFDLPDQPGDYDHRAKTLSELTRLKVPGLIILSSYDTRFAQAYASLPRQSIEGVVFKRRSSLYAAATPPKSATGSSASPRTYNNRATSNFTFRE
jgi:ATP-dependent DNA ligase